MRQHVWVLLAALRMIPTLGTGCAWSHAPYVALALVICKQLHRTCIAFQAHAMHCTPVVLLLPKAVACSSILAHLGLVNPYTESLASRWSMDQRSLMLGFFGPHQIGVTKHVSNEHP